MECDPTDIGNLPLHWKSASLCMLLIYSLSAAASRASLSNSALIAF